MNNEILYIIGRSSWLLDERVFPWLGILKVAAAFEEQGYRSTMLDLSGITNWKQVLKEFAANNKKQFDFIAYTATTPNVPEVVEVVSEARVLFPGTKQVLGGTHATSMNAATKNEIKRGVLNGRAKQSVDKLLTIFDILVCGDGEMTLKDILALDKGIVDADDRKSNLFLSDDQFTNLPEPRRTLIDIQSYKYFIDGHKATSVVGQLGCPYGCQFCGMRLSPSMRLIRNRTVDSIVKEVKGLYDIYGFTGFMFYDDELNVSKSMIELMNKLTDLQLKLGVSFAFRGFLKSEITTEEQMIALKKANFSILLCGFESGNDRILKNIEKKATKEDNTRFVELAKKHGLKTKALMSLGHPGESFETINDTKQWLLDVQPEDFDATVITTFGSSPYYDLATHLYDDVYVYTHAKSGDKLYQKTIDFTKEAGFYKGSELNYRSYVWTDYITAEQLVEERNKLENEVRTKLNIPFNPSSAAKAYECSMGQSGELPDWILRTTPDNFMALETPHSRHEVTSQSTILPLTDAAPFKPKRSLNVI